ncbi:Glucoamylase (glucan-1,4-alpha-glucosidase), GH15 family [Streptomyces sp. DvalAA-14]|uniref:glycoside hydrolase family 15 protein n=1 Tax=unclassified Streptomyces TaxID=2593676 RepID=UPI00081B9C4E|nr:MULTISPECIES: glycoside hydrolase family 15 protein [unclassified Streptomyces]MYS24077.1 glycoside hydrolase family 15 protein [Streptomyces sp. SID4948]SCE42374.1 Glucoamylase (glucan-1,4-alpha-glucosidase), GH15 family [Streptomyces sp. DvalAA-14]
MSRIGAEYVVGEDYLPVAEHGLIGDLRTVALVGTDGRIDWFCAPRFDSPSVFGSLLDARKGGHWTISPDCRDASRQQFYFPETNILITRMLTDDGIVEIQDFMPLVRAHDPGHRQRLVRRVVGIRGRMRMSVEIAPRLDYGRARHRTALLPTGVRFTGEELSVTVHSDVGLRVEGDDARGLFTIEEGETVLFVLHTADPVDPAAGDPGTADADGVDADAVDALFRATTSFWHGWLRQSTYSGRWREMVERSALTLKLLTHEPSGAVVAAPTLGLPESIGGERNWDYRYVWIRDAAFSLYALLRLGFTEEAKAFIQWLTACLHNADETANGPLRVLYSIDGHADLPETVLDHLEGYRGSRPVRIGNDAAGQLQLDIYGELIDSIYLFNKYSVGISHDSWMDLCTIVDWLIDHWSAPDEGIWETRAGPQDHTYSRLMCWVAVERMIRMARQRGLPGDLVRWSEARDRMYHQIIDRGWNEGAGTFLQRLSDGQDAARPVVDAALLLMPMVKFLSPDDPRFRSTMDAIEDQLVMDSLVYRYDPTMAPDGLTGPEGTFTICSFWWVEALTRTGQIERARLALEKTFTYANHLGLYSEQIGMTGEHLGNFPQAFTHLALISATTNLDRAMS